MTGALAARLEWGLVPAVPVPFRGTELDETAQRAYARWMAAQPVAGVAVWAHTGRGPHLSAEQRRTVLETWREAMPNRVIVAGARDITMAIEARRGHADALLAFPASADPVAHHARLSRELPVIAFWLYEAAGGVAYDDATLHAILDLPGVIGIKVATLDSVMTFQRLAALMERHPDKLLITGEDRFLGYSIMLGARAALVGMGAALPDLQAGLLKAYAEGDWPAFHARSALCDRLALATFIAPMEGYVRRMLWAAAADGAVPADACDDPWGPSLPPGERDAVERVVREARAREVRARDARPAHA
ncbi:MAG TPA: dihydrodipicolinate synthase family protein [Gemmatimonadales bacterium]|nr:dihydrodipicolinate synthase family protein [Gemmatimonadales bacterium]